MTKLLNFSKDNGMPAYVPAANITAIQKTSDGVVVIYDAKGIIMKMSPENFDVKVDMDKVLKDMAQMQMPLVPFPVRRNGEQVSMCYYAPAAITYMNLKERPDGGYNVVIGVKGAARGIASYAVTPDEAYVLQRAMSEAHGTLLQHVSDDNGYMEGKSTVIVAPKAITRIAQMGKQVQVHFEDSGWTHVSIQSLTQAEMLPKNPDGSYSTRLQGEALLIEMHRIRDEIEDKRCFQLVQKFAEATSLADVSSSRRLAFTRLDEVTSVYVVPDGDRFDMQIQYIHDRHQDYDLSVPFNTQEEAVQAVKRLFGQKDAAAKPASVSGAKLKRTFH